MMLMQLLGLGLVLIFVLKLSKMLFHTLLSPLGLYALIWLPLFGLYLMRLIDYEPINDEMWYAVSISFLSFCLGSATPVVAWKSVLRVKSNHGCRGTHWEINFTLRKKLTMVLVVLCVFSLLSVLGQWVILVGKFGGVEAIFEQGYNLRLSYVEGERFGIFDYLHIFAFVGAIFGGMYLALFGFRRFRNFISYIPILVIVSFAVPVSARLNILWGVFLYGFGYAFTRFGIGRSIKLTWRKGIALVAVSMTVFLVLNQLWLIRIGGEYPLHVQYASPEILTFKEFILDVLGIFGYGIAGNLVSNYVYATNTFAKLNAVVGGTAAPDVLNWGTMSFAAFFRLFRKIGVIEGKFSGQLGTIFAPIPLKPGTYLAQAYYDYGWIGVLILPYLLGSVSSWAFIRLKSCPSFTLIGLLAILYLAIFYSFHGSLFMHTAPVGALLLWLGVGKIIDARVKRAISS